MAVLTSNMLALGTSAPDFSLPSPCGELHSLSSTKKKNGLLVVFMCNHCPFVIHMKEQLALAGERLSALNVGMVGINSNDVANYPNDAANIMQQDIDKFSYSFPYVSDGTQDVAKAYQAACTPDFFLFNHDLKLVYRGQFDDSRPGNGQASGADLYLAIDAMLAGQALPEDQQQPSAGCSIKWKSGS